MADQEQQVGAGRGQRRHRHDTATTLRGGAVLVAVASALGVLAAWRMVRGWGRSRLL